MTENLRDIELTLNDGTPTTLNTLAGSDAVLLVNTASKCGLTVQYEGLQALADEYAGKGLTVVGAPCNQFNGQEPGTDEEIRDFACTRYNVSFPLLSKLEVNGPGAHPLYKELTTVPDSDGEAGDVAWNFEKFLITPDGAVAARIRPKTEPQDPAVTEAIETVLAP
ncbi:glutathione peroxidase [Corynebacterium auris]|uniref:glutathione peroxidase n=1 Tax=Corynebacterium auris TaxID=44750 RepID=UPI0025B45A9F|nr:glutathione peroxidase [Corynebacterium auris]WJY68737.1 Hydroperoxy fatty acid reductase gpx2 [Corynebacterium auris]